MEINVDDFRLLIKVLLIIMGVSVGLACIIATYLMRKEDKKDGLSLKKKLK